MNLPGGGSGTGIAFLAEPSAGIAAAAGGLGGLDALLSGGERDAALRLRRAPDRLDYAASHALFRLLAAWQLGLGPEAAAMLEVRRTCAGCGSTNHGKPGIDGAGLSLSRSHGMVMAAAGPAGCALGVDIEKAPAAVFAGFDDFAVAPTEGNGPGSAGFTDAGFTESGFSDGDRIRLWVLKEALLKAAGLGLAIDPSAVRLVPAGDGGILGAHSPGNPAVDGLLACAVPAPCGYAAAVAAGSFPAGSYPAGLPLRRLSLAEIFATKG